MCDSRSLHFVYINAIRNLPPSSSPLAIAFSRTGPTVAMTGKDGELEGARAILEDGRRYRTCAHGHADIHAHVALLVPHIISYLHSCIPVFLVTIARSGS